MICPLTVTYEINVQPFGQLLQTEPNPLQRPVHPMNIQMPFPKVFKLSEACV